MFPEQRSWNTLGFLELILEQKIKSKGFRPIWWPEKDYENASWVGSRLAELLPIRLEQKQYFLQLDDPIQRMERLAVLLEEMEISWLLK